MLSRDDNERVTRVGPGTPMGNTMRRYWLPALLAWELPEPDCPPVRVKLLGEELVAFRDSRGRIGLLDERCPHRRASLFFGRNEECGLRCVYHGWKFDVDGRCVDMMNEPEELAFAAQDPHRAPIRRWRRAASSGPISGPAEQRPPLPHFAWTQAPPTHRHVSKVIQESNWLQGARGRHRHLARAHPAPASSPPTPRGPASSRRIRSCAARRPRSSSTSRTTATGTPACGRSTSGERARAHLSLHPAVPPDPPGSHRRRSAGFSGAAGHIWVPMDDETTMVYNWEHSTTEPLTDEDRLERRLGNGPLDVDQTTFRSKRNRENNYLLDRHVQKTETLHRHRRRQRAGPRGAGEHGPRSSIAAASISGPADRAVIQARRLLLQAIKTVEAGGTPPGVEPTYYTLHPAEAVVPRDTDWRTLLAPGAPRGGGAAAGVALEIPDPRHHVAADALERAQHELVVADDVPHHHVVEAHARGSGAGSRRRCRRCPPVAGRSRCRDSPRPGWRRRRRAPPRRTRRRRCRGAGPGAAGARRAPRLRGRDRAGAAGPRRSRSGRSARRRPAARRARPMRPPSRRARSPPGRGAAG